jgi:hypothetical protein
VGHLANLVDRLAHGLAEAAHVGHGEVLAGEAGIGGLARAMVRQGEERHIEPPPVPMRCEQDRGVDPRIAHGEAVQRQDRAAGPPRLVDPVIDEDRTVAAQHAVGVGEVVALDAPRDDAASVDPTAVAARHAKRVGRLVQEGEEAARLGLELRNQGRLGRVAQGVDVLGIGNQRPLHHELHRAQDGGVESEPDTGEETAAPSLARKLDGGKRRIGGVADGWFDLDGWRQRRLALSVHSL